MKINPKHIHIFCFSCGDEMMMGEIIDVPAIPEYENTT
jgi:hypothetical protein